MNATWIIAVFVIIDDLMTHLDHHSHHLAHVPDAEVLTVAIVAAKDNQNHHERTLCLMQQLCYLSGSLSTSRFNRRLHALADWLAFLPEVLANLVAEGDVFVIDSLPVPVCRRVRAWRCRNKRGRVYCGYCAGKDEKFFGWRLHLVCTPQGIPGSFQLLPASLHDLTPIHELTIRLPQGARLFGDKGYNSAKDDASILAESRVR